MKFGKYTLGVSFTDNLLSALSFFYYFCANLVWYNPRVLSSLISLIDLSMSSWPAIAGKPSVILPYLDELST